MKPIGLLAIIFLIAGCGNNSPVPDFTSWEGTWKTSSGSSSFTETWTKTNTQLWSGTGTWRENDSISYEEKLSLRYNGKDCVYSALAPDQNNEQSVDFMLSLFTDSTWVFVNPKHDFPNKIEYQLLSSRMMKVDVTGIEKGKPRSLSFSLIKKP
jgi:hypothetical protein